MATQYNADRVRILHNRICAIVEAKNGLRQLSGFKDVIKTLERKHAAALRELNHMTEPKNPTYDLP